MASLTYGAGHAPALSAAKRFGRYTPEAEGRLRELQNSGNRVQDALHAAWHECAGRDGTGDERYFWATSALQYALYSPADVEAFSVAMCGFGEPGFPSMAGYYLSALVNGGPPGAYTLHATSSGRMIDHLGYWNSKDLLVKGPAGLSAGEEMPAGNLVIEGGAEHHLGLDAGGPLVHVIAAKAVAFKEALSETFVEYQTQVVKNARELARALMSKGFKIISDGTDTHLMLIDLANKSITGKDAESVLDLAGITVNKNAIPYDDKPPTVTSGIRLGTPIVTSRKMKETEMAVIAGLISQVIDNAGKPEIESVKEEVETLCRKYPVYEYMKI